MSFNTVDIRELNERIERQSAFVDALVMGMNQTIVGQKHLVESLLIGLLSDGHVLLEGVPGLAKTLAIKTLAQLIDADYSRIQFTPDLLPADVVGTMIYSQKNENFDIKKGPVFANFVLADEINRAPAKVQSALLEAMQEHQVTIGEETFKLPEPFLVLATQNPIEQEGTYPLPEAQVDRFMLKVVITYPQREEERQIVSAHLKGGFNPVKPILKVEDIIEARKVVREVYMDEKIERYIVDLVYATRFPEEFGLKEFGLKRQQTYNYMNVGKKFLDTNGNLVLKTDEIWNITQLVEMKTLPIKTINEWMENGTVNSTMTAKQIRELVKQNG